MCFILLAEQWEMQGKCGFDIVFLCKFQMDKSFSNSTGLSTVLEAGNYFGLFLKPSYICWVALDKP